MNLLDIIKNANSFIGDSSTDRVTADERYQACTEATAWLLEELGNEHMTDRAEIEYLPTVTWYKMDSLTPYLLTAGQLRFKEEKNNRTDFTRVEPRDLASMRNTGYAYAIERYNSDSYLGIKLPYVDETEYQELIALNVYDGLTYTGVNAVNITGEDHAIRFDMETTGEASTGLTTTKAVDLTNYINTGVLVFEFEIPDIEDVNSVTIKFGDDLTSNYYYNTVTQDVNGNALVSGVNTIKIRWQDLTKVGTPTPSTVTEWGFYMNHETDKTVIEGLKLSDLIVAKPIYLNFKYVFYRVGKNASGTDIIEFSADTDVPFFIDRYPQYRYAVAHKAAASLFRMMQDPTSAGSEDSQANRALKRYRKNFSNEVDSGSSAFRPAGVRFRGVRTIRRR